ncbi:hypothetical protein UB33_11255 [Photobacterium angustum]|uniref:hypothetical protein n=1 Tax=Photobacterium angustum TaxID=661 RepID=UPI0005E24316|nr:hypothetical protein [Photobacterium angustum]KJF94003.1 hypothetical protein UB39_12330 [Photobacterium angustum]KJG05934.1 hypothetical protein UB33_11255 [Photobacterium angustum]PSV92573.1 hypothetical protein CTN01_12150 [Photobacterium angustum]PSW82550.1 hypothetical protein CTN03_05105 [Photobacterium angustum]
MDSFVTLVTAFGLGGVIVKLIDIFLLQRFLKKKELDNWLREKRYIAYSEATKNLISMGFNSEDDSPFIHLTSLSETLLLVDNEDLHSKIREHIFDRNELNKAHDQNPDSAEFKRLFSKVDKDSNDIILSLKSDLRGQIYQSFKQ